MSDIEIETTEPVVKRSYIWARRLLLIAVVLSIFLVLVLLLYMNGKALYTHGL